MTISRSQLIDRIKQAGAQAVTAGDGSEIAVACPRCSPIHNNRRLTLYINAESGSFICHRCTPRFVGSGGERRIESLTRVLRELGVDPTGIDTPLSLGLSEIRSRLRGNKIITDTIVEPVMLPIGYRTDFSKSHAGRIVLRYLASRGVSQETIRRYSIGYGSCGDTWGHAIFPVLMSGQLKFWQARNAFLRSPTAKYLSCANAKKTDVLFGYDLLNADDEITIVEGVFDSLAVPNSVALFGKTISDVQILALQNLKSRKINIMLDGDAHAASRYLAQRLRTVLPHIDSLSVRLLPAAYDPAEFFAMCRNGSMPKAELLRLV